jgi:hypothetical protein
MVQSCTQTVAPWGKERHKHTVAVTTNIKLSMMVCGPLFALKQMKSVLGAVDHAQEKYDVRAVSMPVATDGEPGASKEGVEA